MCSYNYRFRSRKLNLDLWSLLVRLRKKSKGGGGSKSVVSPLDFGGCISTLLFYCVAPLGYPLEIQPFATYSRRIQATAIIRTQSHNDCKQVRKTYSLRKWWSSAPLPIPEIN